MTVHQPTLDAIKWKSIRDVVHKINPDFAKIIDNLDVSDDFILYKARYPFGSMIIDVNKFYLPYNDKLVPLDDPQIPEELKKLLGYNSYNTGSLPLGICLNRSVELYMQQSDHRLIPFSLMDKGKIFGLWGSLNRNISYIAPKVWHMTAGARCIFFLPKITDTPSYKKLCKARSIKLPMPTNLLEQGPLLAQLAKHKDCSPWFTEMLYFPRNWLEKRDTEAWANFHLFLHEIAWEGTEHWRNKVVYDYIWDTFVKDLTRRNIKVLPYIVDIVEHLIMIGLGVLPGFAPAIDEEIAPIESFKIDFVDIYGLKHFAPTIMIPKHLSHLDDKCVYWSLQLPTYFESTPKPRKENSIISDLKEVKNLLERFINAVLDQKIEAVLGTPFYDFIKEIRFDFFHSDIYDLEDGIRPSSEMPIEDKNLIKCSTKFGRRGFSEISPFVRGCVRISLLKPETMLI